MLNYVCHHEILFKGIENYVQSWGFDDSALAKFVVGLVWYWEMYFSQPKIRHEGYNTLRHFHITVRFIYGVLKSVREVDTDEIYELLEDDARLSFWADIIRLHGLLLRYLIFNFSSS